jgi:ATP-dependent helicase HrpB
LLATVTLVAALSQERSIVRPLDKREERERREEFFASRIAGLEHRTSFKTRGFQVAAEAGFACRLPALGHPRRWGARGGPPLRPTLRHRARHGTAGGGQTGGDSSQAIRKCILTGFSDQLAKRLDRATLRCALVQGRRGDLRASRSWRRRVRVV